MMDSENIVGDGLTKILLLMAMMWTISDDDDGATLNHDISMEC